MEEQGFHRCLYLFLCTRAACWQAEDRPLLLLRCGRWCHLVGLGGGEPPVVVAGGDGAFSAGTAVLLA